MWVPHKEFKKKRSKNKKLRETKRGGERSGKESFFIIFFLNYVHSQILKFPTIGFRRDKHGKCSTQRGLRVSTKNTRFHREFR